MVHWQVSSMYPSHLTKVNQLLSTEKDSMLVVIANSRQISFAATEKLVVCMPCYTRLCGRGF